MGKKVNPTGLRLGIISTWKSKWFSARGYAHNLRQDVEIREFVSTRWKSASIAEVGLERSANTIKVVIKTSRPGVLIGRGGTGIEDISSAIKKKFFSNKKVDLKIEVQEVKQFEENAMLVSQNVAEQLEKRVPFRKILKSMLDQVEKNKNVKGIKIEVSGRLGGAEMSRREWLSRGTVPLHTLRADIDFARSTAHTTHGSIGVKVWLYKGEVFDRN
ncbi:MAG: Ribosomal protein S3 [uncultured bacterium]|nr:MAG: Ribosomal protein S3 [uncultured bacterium]HBR71856.1 30S ribosomal protein S3 [Candidatus Moranbacteria bacterium]